MSSNNEKSLLSIANKTVNTINLFVNGWWIAGLIVLGTVVFTIIFMFSLPNSNADQFNRINESGKNLEYISTGQLFEADWQILLAFDMTRYENDIVNADPLDSMLKITKLNVYTKTVTNKNGKEETREKIRTYTGRSIITEAENILGETITYSAVTVSAELEKLPDNYILKSSSENQKTYIKTEIKYLTVEEIEKAFNFSEDEIKQFKIAATSGILESYIMPYTELKIDISPNLERSITGFFSVPMDNVRCSSPFGMRIHPLKKIPINHRGMDLVLVSGNDKRVYSSAPGTVVKVTVGSERGIYVKVKHVTKDGTVLYSIYQHLARATTREGAKVDQTTVIGIMGSTGLSTGDHLHFEIWSSDDPKSAFNPATLLQERN